MRTLRKWRRRIDSLFHRERLDRDLDDELRDFLEREIADAVAAGVPRKEAERRALRELAGLTQVKEECREARGTRWLDDAAADARYAVRTLRKAPAFTATVVAALAVCIGGNAAIFSIVDTVLFRPLPFPEAERLMSATEGVPGLGFPVLPFSPPDYLFVAEHNRSFAATGTYRTRTYEVSGAGQPHHVIGARVTASLFGTLGIAPALGRGFTQEEDDLAKRVAVLAAGFAQSAYGDASRALGQTILLERTPYTVVGVMPRAFTFPIRGSRFSSGPAEVFVPVSWSAEDRQQNVSNFDYNMVARLRPGVSVDEAGADVRRLLGLVVSAYPAKIKEALDRTRAFSLESRVAPFREEFTGNVRRPLILLLAAVGVVLLIGCADVANLMFSRAVGRRREFAVRAALGAGRWRLARQTLTEGLALAVAGGVAGLALAHWTLPLLVRLAPEDLPRLGEVGLNWRVTLFVAAAALATPLVFCLGPVASAARWSLADPLRGARVTGHGRAQRLTMSAAVVAQFGLAFVLLATAGLLTRSLMKASGADPGFRPERVLSASIALPGSAYQKETAAGEFFDRLVERVNALPGVRHTGAVSDLPMGSSSNGVMTIEGRGGATERVDMIFCRGLALEALGVTLRRGRFLRPEDQIGSAHSAVISESLARRAWPGRDPVGRRLKFGVDVPFNDQPWLTVVGVVADVKSQLTSTTPRLLVFTTPRPWVKEMTVVARTAGEPELLAGVIRREVAALDGSLPPPRIETLPQVLANSLAAERFRTRLVVGFAAAALLLAALGIAGLLAYQAAQRAPEFGLRIALGAGRGDLLLLVVRHSLRLSGAGIAIGLVASVGATRALAALLYETSPLDPGTFLAAAGLLAVVALGAAAVPAWRAVRADPVTALRGE